MRISRFASRPLHAGIGLLWLLACSNEDQLSGPEGMRAVAGEVEQLLTPDQVWAYVARTQVPGFAGYYLVQGSENVVLNLVSGSDVERAKAFVRSELQKVKVIPTGISIKSVPYGWNQLQSWKDAAVHLLNRGDLISMDIDERIPRIIIGARDQQAIAAITPELRDIGIPDDALTVMVVPRIQKRDSLSQAFVDTAITGGMLINVYYPKPGCGPNCAYINYGTFGLLANGFADQFGSVATFLTASHVTPYEAQVDTATFFQPAKILWYQLFNTALGPDFSDPPLIMNCTSIGYPGLTRCRWADVAAVRWPSQSAATRAMGTVARTQWVGLNGVDGSKVVDANSPKWDIIGNSGTAPVGYWVNKVGMQSGWTRGYVLRSCVDFYDADLPKNLICQNEAYLRSRPGDSGSPVFSDENNSQYPS